MLPLTVNQCAEQSPTVVVEATPDALTVVAVPWNAPGLPLVEYVARRSISVGVVTVPPGRLSSTSRTPFSDAMTNRPAVAQLVLLASLVISSVSPAAWSPSACGTRYALCMNVPVLPATEPPPYGSGSYGVA